jgi:tripartite-type tricarboxylate transporter receptor subunit TctC
MAQRLMNVAVALLAMGLVGAPVAPAAAWEPTKPVEFVVPAGTGGGADQMARLIAPLVDKYKLSPRPLVVVNKSGGAGAEGFTYVKAKSGDAHTIIITLSNLFTTPLHTGVPFNWKDLTPVARLALDEFILWVNTDRPDKKDFKTAKDYIAAVKSASGGDGKMKMGGTGTAQEDQIITVLLEQALGVKFIYVPFKGGGEVCVNLVGNHVDSTVNNPIECAGHLKAGRVRPLAVFDTKRLSAPGWGDIPTIKEALGADISYLMLRGIFGAPSMPAEAVAFYQGMLQKVYETPEFKEYLTQGALNPAWQIGPDFVKWLDGAETLHKGLMAKGGLLK